MAKDDISIAKDAMEAAKDAHAICVLTEWDEFKEYDYQKVGRPEGVTDGNGKRHVLASTDPGLAMASCRGGRRHELPQRG